MPITTQFPSSFRSNASNITGAITDIDEDVDSPDANWVTPTNVADTLNCPVVFSGHSTNLETGSTNQKFRGYYRQASTDTGTLRIQLWQNNNFRNVEQLFTGITTATEKSMTWGTTDLSSTGWNGVEFQSRGDGNNNVDVGAVNWELASPSTVANPQMKYWNGSAWTLKDVKYWDGSAWSNPNAVNEWNGSAWVQVSP